MRPRRTPPARPRSRRPPGATWSRVDLGDPDFSQADQYVLSDDLGRGGETVSQTDGVYTATRVNADGSSTLQASNTYSLPDGQVTAQGRVDHGAREEVKVDPYTLAVTGGTGRYSAAAARSRSRSRAPPRRTSR